MRQAVAFTMFVMRSALVLLALLVLSCDSRRPKVLSKAAALPSAKSQPPTDAASPVPAPTSRMQQTQVTVRNVNLAATPEFHIRIRWMRGALVPTSNTAIPSLDFPDSFSITIDAGVVVITLKDLEHLLNTQVLKNSPLRNVSLSARGRQLRVAGTLEKAIPLPVEMIGDLSPGPENRVRIHIVKLRVLKVPVGGLLKVLHLKTEDLFDSKGVRGVTVRGDDVYLNCTEILPAPHPEGRLSAVHLGKASEIVEVYGGNERPEAIAPKPWRNFIRMRGGSMGFGKLAMNFADIWMIDPSQGKWFNLDVKRYQEQIVHGYARLTPEAGIQMFMPDIGKVPRTKANLEITPLWMKYRNISPPPDVPQ